MSADLTTIATFSDPVEAELVAARLEDEGIAAVVSGDLMSSTFSGLGYMAGGIDVLVPAAELDRARTVLSNFAKEIEARKNPSPTAITAVPPVPEMEADEPSAPDLPVNSNERRIERAFRAAILGYFLCPPILHIYSLVVLLSVAFQPSEKSESNSAKFYVAFALDAFGLVYTYWLFSWFGLFR